MQLTYTRVATGPSAGTLRAAAPARMRPACRAPLRIRAHEEDLIPIIKGSHKKEFTEKELKALANPKLLGGKTIGEELALIRERHADSETKMRRGQASLVSGNWGGEGDVPMHGRWNTLSVLYLIFMLAPALVGVFAYMTYGTLWATGAYY